MRSTLCKSIFGGRITTDIDQDTLDRLVGNIFIPECFNVNFKLVEAEKSPCLPDTSSRNDCFSWIESLPSYTPTVWIGLDGSAEQIRSKAVAKSIMGKFDRVQAVLSEE